MLQKNTKCVDVDVIKSGVYYDFVHFKNIRASVFIFVQKKGSLLFAQGCVQRIQLSRVRLKPRLGCV